MSVEPVEPPQSEAALLFHPRVGERRLQGGTKTVAIEDEVSGGRAQGLVDAGEGVTGAFFRRDASRSIGAAPAAPRLIFTVIHGWGYPPRWRRRASARQSAASSCSSRPQ